MHKESGEDIACNALKPILQGADRAVNFGDDLLCPVFMFCVDMTHTRTIGENWQLVTNEAVDSEE